MNENLSSIINNCYKSVQHRTLSDEEVSLIDGSLFRFRMLFDHIMDNPEKTMTVLFSSELDSEVLYYPVDIIEFRKILSDGHLSDCCGLALFSYKVAKKWLGDYPILLGVRVDKRDLHSYGGFGIYKYGELGLAGTLERMVVDTDVVNDVSFADIEDIVREENVKADLIRVKEPRALSEMVLANYYGLNKKAQKPKADWVPLRTFMEGLGVKIEKKGRRFAGITWPDDFKQVATSKNWGHFERVVRGRLNDSFIQKILAGQSDPNDPNDRKEFMHLLGSFDEGAVKSITSYFDNNQNNRSQVEAKVFDLLWMAGIRDFETDYAYAKLNDLGENTEAREKIIAEFRANNSHLTDDQINQIIDKSYVAESAQSDIKFAGDDKLVEIFGGGVFDDYGKARYELRSLVKKYLASSGGENLCWIHSDQLRANRILTIARKLDDGFCCTTGGCSQGIIATRFEDIISDIAVLIGSDADLDNWVGFLRGLQSTPYADAMVIIGKIDEKVSGYFRMRTAQISMNTVLDEAASLIDSVNFDRIEYLYQLDEQFMDNQLNMFSKGKDLNDLDRVALFYGTDKEQFYLDIESMKNFSMLLEVYPQIENLEQFSNQPNQQEIMQPEQVYNIQDYTMPDQQMPMQQQMAMQQQIAAEGLETLFKLATSNMGMGPDSGLEESGHGYEGGIQQMEEQKKYVHPNIIPSKYKQGDMVQFRGGGIGDDPGSKGKIIAVRNDKVTIQWTEGKRKGKTHTIPKDSVILDRYIQII